MCFKSEVAEKANLGYIIKMNKARRVAIHKHRGKRKKLEAKRKTEKTPA